MADDPDAGKRDKSSVEYSRSKGEDRCGVCKYIMPNGGSMATCRKVKGSIDPGYWCILFEKRK